MSAHGGDGAGRKAAGMWGKLQKKITVEHESPYDMSGESQEVVRSFVSVHPDIDRDIV